MKTKLTEMVGIKYPIVLSGMSWISVPKMVAAVSNAGGLGILATGPLNSEQTRKAVREIRSLTDKPFGANASLMFPGAAENAKVLLQETLAFGMFSPTVRIQFPFRPSIRVTAQRSRATVIAPAAIS